MKPERTTAGTPSGRTLRRWLMRRRGGAALEFMLVLPTLLLVFIGMLSLGNYVTTRYALTSAAGAAARACSMAPPGQPLPQPQACAQAVVPAVMPPNLMSRCSALRVQTSTPNLPGTSLRQLNVTLTCTYAGLFGGNFLANAGVQLAALQVQASMPLP